MTPEEQLLKQLEEVLGKKQNHIESGPELLVDAESIEMVCDFTEWGLKLYTLKYLQLMKDKLYELQCFNPLLYHCPNTPIDFKELHWSTQSEKILKNIPLVIQETHTVQQCIRDLVNEVDGEILKYEHDLKQLGEQ